MLMKYSDYANDMVLADILSYLLLKERNKIPFLNNANMHGIGSALERLIEEVETEMGQIQQEKSRLRRTFNVVSEDRFLEQILKKSRFKKALQATHKTSKIDKSRSNKSLQSQPINSSMDKRYLCRRNTSIGGDISKGSTKSIKHPRYRPQVDLEANDNESGSATELQLNDKYSDLNTLQQLMEILDKAKDKNNPELIKNLKQLRKQRQNQIISIMNRKQALDEKS